MSSMYGYYALADLLQMTLAQGALGKVEGSIKRTVSIPEMFVDLRCEVEVVWSCPDKPLLLVKVKGDLFLLAHAQQSDVTICVVDVAKCRFSKENVVQMLSGVTSLASAQEALGKAIVHTMVRDMNQKGAPQ